jgi:eukaryotic-like serine/threonine-protein kinase
LHCAKIATLLKAGVTALEADRWRQVERIFHDALDLQRSEQTAFIENACAGDALLKKEVEAMIRFHEKADSFLESPPDEVVTAPVDLGAMKPTPWILGHYEVRTLLGSGGTGDVYLAWDTHLNRLVAIKFLSPDVADESARRRFQEEARMASALNHPHILTVHEAGEFEGRQYLVSEFIDGGTLGKWARDTQPGWRQSVELLIGVADGLACAHEAGILHRDIKPDNILVTKTGYAKLADFGLAKFVKRAQHDLAGAPTADRTQPGVIMGTIAYMSPEQALGGDLDARSDIFSFGVVLFEILTGRRPFEGATDPQRLRAVIHAPAPSIAELRPDVPARLRAAVEKMLEKEPARRYDSAREIVTEFRILLHEGGEASATHDRYLRAPRALGILGGLVAILIAAYGIIWLDKPTALEGPHIQALAVLPLTNLSGDPAQEFFADGMTEALIADLAQISALRVVISRTSIMQFKGTKKLLPEIARELHVDAVVEGSVLRSGNRVQIIVELIDAATERHRRHP